jgi:hypothetical protein
MKKSKNPMGLVFSKPYQIMLKVGSSSPCVKYFQNNLRGLIVKSSKVGSSSPCVKYFQNNLRGLKSLKVGSSSPCVKYFQNNLRGLTSGAKKS